MISFITVAYNSASTIRACLEAARAQPGSEVIVVDNASADDTLAICRQIPGIKLIPHDANIGFNGGNNLGLAQASGDIVVLLNPDAVLPANVSPKIEQLFAKLPDVGMIGCRMVNADGSLQSTGSQLPSLRTLLYEHSAYHNLFPHSRTFARYLIKDWDRSTSRRLGAVAGSCLAMRRADLEACGGLDSHYFLFYEEVDLARAMAKIGKVAYYAADIQVQHIGGVSTKQDNSAKIDAIYHASRDYYLRKWHGPAYLATFKTLAWLLNKGYGLWSTVARRLPGRPQS
jgi:GT2 family glycosyltransferase